MGETCDDHFEVEEKQSQSSGQDVLAEAQRYRTQFLSLPVLPAVTRGVLLCCRNKIHRRKKEDANAPIALTGNPRAVITINANLLTQRKREASLCFHLEEGGWGGGGEGGQKALYELEA